MQHPESHSQSPSVARFSTAQRRRLRAWARRHSDWDVSFFTITSDQIDPGAHPSEAVSIHLPSHFSDTFRGSNGWTVYPTTGELVAVSFDTERGAAVVNLADALRDISKLRVYEITDEDDDDAARCVPMFFPRGPSGPTHGHTHAKASVDSLEAVA